ncbi:hypothetical protein NL676_007446 [Syzygium grande]|nr:hypothetical protein NL676_007446 [Syzygium grande]
MAKSRVPSSQIKLLSAQMQESLCIDVAGRKLEMLTMKVDFNQDPPPWISSATVNFFASASTVLLYAFQGQPRYDLIEPLTGLRSELVNTSQLWIEIPVFWYWSIQPWAVTMLD